MIESNDFNDEDEIQVTIRLLFKGFYTKKTAFNFLKIFRWLFTRERWYRPPIWFNRDPNEKMRNICQLFHDTNKLLRWKLGIPSYWKLRSRVFVIALEQKFEENSYERNDLPKPIKSLYPPCACIYSGNQVGTIIGRKGTKITQIREESACEIKVKGNDQDVERIILVAGLPSGIFFRRRLIFYHF